MNTPPALDAESLLSLLTLQIKQVYALPSPPALLEKEPYILGIHSGGDWVAERLHQALGLSTPRGSLDISFYRDDFSQRGLRPGIKKSQVPFELGGRRILLVDDVLYTGRTTRAALNEIFDYGRPAEIRLAVLVDRGGRELPITADFVGVCVPVSPQFHLVLESLPNSDTGSVEPSKSSHLIFRWEDSPDAN